MASMSSKKKKKQNKHPLKSLSAAILLLWAKAAVNERSPSLEEFFLAEKIFKADVAKSVHKKEVGMVCLFFLGFISPSVSSQQYRVKDIK